MKKTNRHPALTARQQEVLGIIRKYVYRRGYGPSMRELSFETGIRSPNGIMLHLVALGKKGYIYRNRDKSQLLQVVRRRVKKNPVMCLKSGRWDPLFPEEILFRLNALGVRSRSYSLIYISDNTFPPFRPGDVIFVHIRRCRPSKAPFFYWTQPTDDVPNHAPQVRVNTGESVRRFPTGSKFAAFILKMRLTSEAEAML